MAEQLFDELLSPSEEDGPDCMEVKPQHESQQIAGPGGDQIGIQGSKSMENILLENSGMEESIDLGNNSCAVEDKSDAAVNIDLEESKLSSDEEEISDLPVESSIPHNDQDPESDHPASPGTSSATDLADKLDKPRSPGDITKYFAQDPQCDKAEDIFNSLAASAPEKQLPSEEAEPKSDHEQHGSSGTTLGHSNTENEEMTSPDPIAQVEKAERRVRIHLESHSSVSEEATTVDFEEDKGAEPLKPTPSTRSLTKYFTSDSTQLEDEAKSFFDTFTADEHEESTGTCLRIGGSDQSGSAPVDGGVMFPPETPPIPTGSPIPSPFHQQVSASSSVTDSLPFLPDVTENKDGPRSRTTSLSLLDDAPNKAPQFSVGDADDPFTVGLSISDIDRRNDAWIASEVTRQILVAIITGQTTSIVTPPEHLTRPGLVKDEPLGDPVRDLVQRFLGEQEAQKRVCLSADSVPQDERGLRQLIKAECWRSAIDLTGRLLTQCGQGLGKVGTPSKHTPYTLQLWFCRLALMVRLRLYANTESELQAFSNMDKPDLFYEFYQDKYPGRRGSMVPFGLRVLHAELPLHLGKAQESLDRLYYIHAIDSKILSNLEAGLAEDGSMLSLSDDSRKASRELWEQRLVQLMYSIVNSLLSVKDYAAAVRVLEELLTKDKSKKDKILCSIARIYLQIGDTTTAPKYFARAEKFIPNGAESSQGYMNKGFLSLGLSHFMEAYESFEKALRADPTNAVAANNMAVCALYTGQLTNALGTLENLVQNDPDRYLQEGILFNLCTLYELESSHAIFRKQQLLNLVSKHKGNGFNVACLKIV